LSHGEVRDVDLTHLGDNYESLPGDIEGVHLLDVTGEDEDQDVPRSKLVVLVNRPRLHRLKSG
jgi:hypothetical protein